MTSVINSCSCPQVAKFVNTNSVFSYLTENMIIVKPYKQDLWLTIELLPTNWKKITYVWICCAVLVAGWYDRYVEFFNNTLPNNQTLLEMWKTHLKLWEENVSLYSYINILTLTYHISSIQCNILSKSEKKQAKILGINNFENNSIH